MSAMGICDIVMNYYFSANYADYKSINYKRDFLASLAIKMKQHNVIII